MTINLLAGNLARFASEQLSSSSKHDINELVDGGRGGGIAGRTHHQATTPTTSNNMYRLNDAQLMLMHKCLRSGDEKDTIESLNSTTFSFTLECFQYKLTHDLKFLMLTLVFALLISLDILSNLVVLVSILIEKTKKRVDLCFASNALADLLMGLVIMPMTAIYTLFGHFPFGPLLCFFWNIMDFTAGTASMLHIAFISYDRYLSVSKPYKYTQKAHHQRFSVTGIPTFLILIFIWFFALAAWIPALMYFKSRNQLINTNIFNSESQSVTPVNINTNTSGAILGECNLDAPAYIVVPHAMFVYYLPMVLIVVFYSKTISIVNKKVKRRRSSLVSTKYSTMLNSSMHGGGLNHHNFLFTSQVPAKNLRSKKLFNLTGRNKHQSAQTLTAHMKTLKMFSVYMLVNPKNSSGGGEAVAGGADETIGRGIGGGGGESRSGSASAATNGDANQSGSGSAGAVKVANNINHNQISHEYEDELGENEIKPVTSTRKTKMTHGLNGPSLSFEIRRVDGHVVMVDEIVVDGCGGGDGGGGGGDSKDDDNYSEETASTTTKIKQFSIPTHPSSPVATMNLVVVNESTTTNNNTTSSSFNSTTGSSRIESTSSNAVAATVSSPTTQSTSSVAHKFHTSPSIRLGYIKSRQLSGDNSRNECIIIANAVEKSDYNVNLDNTETVTIKVNSRCASNNRSFNSSSLFKHSRLRLLNKSNSIGSSSGGGVSGSGNCCNMAESANTKLRRCSDFSRLNLEEEVMAAVAVAEAAEECYCSDDDEEDQIIEEKKSPSASPLSDMNTHHTKEIYCNSIEISSSTNVPSSQSKLGLSMAHNVEKQSSLSLDKILLSTKKSSASTNVSGGILKHRNSDVTLVGNRNLVDENTSPSASLRMNNNSNATTNNNSKILSFKISRELEELTANGIRLASNSNKREKHVTYKLGLIMIIFIISWLPFSIMWPLNSICREACIYESLYIFSFWLAYLNSVFTPIILLYNNVKYRRSAFVFARIFVLNPFNCLFRRNKAALCKATSNATNMTVNNNTTNNDPMFEYAANNNSNVLGYENSRASFCRRPSLVNNRRRSIKINY